MASFEYFSGPDCFDVKIVRFELIRYDAIVISLSKNFMKNSYHIVIQKFILIQIKIKQNIILVHVPYGQFDESNQV